MTFDHLRDIVMPLNQVEKFTLDVQQWISNDNQFINGNQMDMLIRQYMPCLQHFHCCIRTMESIDQQVNCSILQLMIFIYRYFQRLLPQ